jgi:multicomponent Na+:H+ antiporter subunit E
LLHSVSLGLVLFATWLLLSGHYVSLLLGLGVVSVVVVVLIARRMDVVDHEGHPVHLTWRLLLYCPWLVWEIFKATLDVSKAILHPKMPIEPKVMDIRATQHTELGQVIYANSITLTPGTVTVALHDGNMMVHALTRVAAEGLETGEMDARVTSIEGLGGREEEVSP